MLRTSAGLLRRPKSDVLSLRGRESLDLLNRLSTNALDGLLPGQSARTILTTEKAKIVDFVTVISRDDELLVMTSVGNAPAVMAWMQKYVIMEEIEIRDVSHGYSTSILIGPEAPSTIKCLDPALGEQGSPEKPMVMSLEETWRLPAYTILSPAGSAPEISHINQVSDETYEMVRIEEGIPEFPKELSLEVNPLEANLLPFVSFTKGCYIGQEVIARIDSHKNLQRRLRGLTVECKPDNVIPAGSRVSQSGQEIGWLTSFCWSYGMEAGIALGYVRTGVAGREVGIAAGNDILRAEICDIPFPVRRW